MIRLLDINVLLALAWPVHEHHTRAKIWFEALRDPWASCPFTECGFIRVSMSWMAVPRVTAAEAQSELAALCQRGQHLFLHDNVSPRDIAVRKITGPKQVSDWYLLALAAMNGACVSTFDGRMGNSTAEAVTELIPAA